MFVRLCHQLNPFSVLLKSHPFSQRPWRFHQRVPTSNLGRLPEKPQRVARHPVAAACRARYTNLRVADGHCVWCNIA